MDILKNLSEISTDYSIFEKDQVLTHVQLNSIAGYLNEQTRLNRVALLGVGIACGLRASLAGTVLSVSKGIGVTTDGDLVYLPEDALFDAFKEYDASSPRYEPFYVENKMIRVYELVRQDARDPRAIPFNQFYAKTGKSFDAMITVLLMESYVKDSDLCSGTDCDNLGKDCKNSLKLLLVDKVDIGSLQKFIATPHLCFSAFDEIAVDRPLVSSAINSAGQLGGIFRTACTNIYNKIVADSGLGKMYEQCSSFLGDVFSADPTGGWKTRLSSIDAEYGPTDTRVQYYYDFLKDLAETFNRFREILFGERTWCCPDLDAFPKHLMLGNVVPGPDPDENRTAFYPSPVTTRTSEQLKHAKFLAKKIDNIIQTFQVPAPGSAIMRITPSLSEEHSLEERAIPHYYQVNTTYPIHKSWNYRLHQRRMDNYNYSYSAAAYGAHGGAANPLQSQIGRFTFFRIEGHLGQDISTVLSGIESEIKSKNLPFAVRSVLLDTDRTKITIKPLIRYTDLHRFHYVLRQDLSHQLDEVKEFSGHFKEKVNAVIGKDVNDASDTYDGPPVHEVVAEKHGVIAEKGDRAHVTLNKSYSHFKRDVTWKQDIKDTMKAAGEFKYNLGKVVKTEFNTPFDSLISSTHVQWLDWLDDIIKKRDEKEDDKMLFSNFISLHPGVEHAAGVVRGGTFVLVYDAGNKVVADFTLPYYCCDFPEEEPEEQPLPKPPVRPVEIFKDGLKILPSRDTFLTNRQDIVKTAQLDDIVKEKLNLFKVQNVDSLRVNLDKKIEDQQKDYFTGMKESMNLMASALTGRKEITAEGAGTAAITDSGLIQKVNDAKAKQQAVTYLRDKAAQAPAESPEKAIYEKQAEQAEIDLATAITETAKYIDEKGTDVSMGSQGMAAVMEVNKSIDTIISTTAMDTVKTTLGNLQTTTKNTSLKLVLGTMTRR